VSPVVDTEDLCDAREVARLIGLSHANSVAAYLRRYRDMPRPVLDLGAGRPRLWSREAMLRWTSLRRRRS
jgi:glutathione-regulated potassium-efflux system ancillary protein KefG